MFEIIIIIIIIIFLIVCFLKGKKKECDDIYIWDNISSVEMESSKWINYSTNMCQSGQGIIPIWPQCKFDLHV